VEKLTSGRSLKVEKAYNKRGKKLHPVFRSGPNPIHFLLQLTNYQAPPKSPSKATETTL